MKLSRRKQRRSEPSMKFLLEAVTELVFKPLVDNVIDGVGDINCKSGLHWWIKKDDKVVCEHCGVILPS